MARILVIEDEAVIQQVLQKVLVDSGHEVVLAGDGKAGLKEYGENAFDLVITDCVMPRMEGIETIMALKKQSPGVRIIAMSGGGRGRAVDYLKMAHHLGAQSTLEKPFSIADLTRAVQAALAPPA